MIFPNCGQLTAFECHCAARTHGFEFDKPAVDTTCGAAGFYKLLRIVYTSKIELA